MQTQKYAVNQHLIETILTWKKSKEISIPEIQRPFVWDSTKVRKLIDSLYKGFPVGYLIAWKNPNVRSKDGTLSEGKKVLIDGQQRVTALAAAILGEEVITEEYDKVKITIAFHPVEERFEVLNSAIRKDVSWIPDISPIITGEARLSQIIKDYCSKNANAKEEVVEDKLENLKQITKKQIGIIELDADLDIETVTEIFIRINSEGVVLSQADFAMSKIASSERFDGPNLRKAIDYFCHLAVKPEFFNHICEVDKDFARTEFLPKMAWMKNENDDLYDPNYSDLLRVAFTSEFGRGKLSDLVNLLSGRNFETRTFEENIAQSSFTLLKKGILNFMNETNFKRFIMILRSAGFIDSSLIRSQNAVDFAYILYLKLRAENYNQARIESYVCRWFILSLLTGRYSGSPESMFDLDIKNIVDGKFPAYLAAVEAAELSSGFWDFALSQSLETSSVNVPAFNVYLASHCKSNTRGLFSKDIIIRDMIEHKGDIHHIFPKDYLKKNGLAKSAYNQVANYTYMQTEINIKIGNRSPKEYFGDVSQQCKDGELKHGAITDYNVLLSNLSDNDIPEDIFNMDIDHYDEFLAKRRKLMTKRIRQYYNSM